MMMQTISLLSRLQHTSTKNGLLALAIFALSVFPLMHAAEAACIDNGSGMFTCSGTSTNTGQQIGQTILDNSGAPAVLNNTSVNRTDETLIANDPFAPNTGASHTVSVLGGNGTATINNTGVIQSARGYFTYNPDNRNFEFTSINPTSIAFTDTSTGVLLNNGTTAGIDAAIFADAGTSLLTVNNNQGVPFNIDPVRSGLLVAAGDFSAVIYGSAKQVVISNSREITNISNTGTNESFTQGHWAIATFGGASYTPPAIPNGTNLATVQSAGLTVINNTGAIYGTVMVVDSNPLVTAAEASDSTLVLAHTAQDVGPRDSIINNAYNPDTKRFGGISGNIYLGSGAHVINNGTLDGTSSSAGINGNIFVDQRATAVTSVVGGVATPEYLVAGARTFTFNQMGQFTGDIVIHDVAESVNNINVYSGLMNPYDFTPSNDPNFNITTDGLGTNNLNIFCFSGSVGCKASGNWTGLSVLNVKGTTWDFSDAAQVISVTNGDINLDAQTVILGATLTADNIIVTNSLQGVLIIEGITPGVIVPPGDTIGTVNGHMINNGSVTIRDATWVINGNADFNAGSNFNLRINSFGNGMLSVNGGNGTFNSNSTVNITTKDRFFRTGDTFTIATNSSGSPIITDPYGILRFTSSDATGDIILTARVGIPDYLNVNTAGNNAVNVLMNYSGTDPGLVKLQTDIQGLSDEELKRAAERLRPEINDSLVRMTMNHSDRVLGVVETHLIDARLRQERGEANGAEEGKQPLGAGLWFQGFGGMGNQEARKNVDGYIATSTGMAAGMDRLVGNGDSLRLGVAGAYAYGNIDNSGITDNNRTNVNSYMGFLYSAWNAEPWYLNTAFGVGRHTYETTRIALGRNAEANHGSLQYTAKADAGWPIAYNDLWTFVPLASASYSRINESGYTEHGTDKSNGVANPLDPGQVVVTNSATNLQIEDKTFDSFRTGLGGKILFALDQPDYSANVELRALYVHEYGDLTNNSIARFTHGGPSFYSPGIRPARDGLIVGSSVRLTSNDGNDQLALLASYDADIREQYFGQAVTLMLRYDLDQGPGYIRKVQHRKAEALARADAQAQAIAVKASERDISNLSKAMAGLQDDVAAELLAADLASPDAKVRQDAQKRQEVKMAIDNWITAISNGNQQVYFNSYAADFVNDEGLSRQQWERKRQKEFKEGGISAIQVADLNIKNQGKLISTVFTQISQRDNKQQAVQKILQLEQRNGRWLILSEDNLPLN